MMEYPFKDLLPLDQVLEREGYYNDWTHLDPEVFYSLTQISEYIKTKGYGVDVRLLISQLAEHFGLKTTQVVDLANLLQQNFENLEGVTQSFTNNINSLVAQIEADKNAIVANATVDSEVILARGGKDTLGERLDETTTQLAQNSGRLDDNAISPDDFSGTDYQKVQQSLDYALGNNVAIRFARMYDLTGNTLMINRPQLYYATERKQLYLLGAGGGIKKMDGSFLFDAEFANTGDINFSGMKFEGTSGAGLKIWNGDKIIRIKGSNNEYRNVDTILSATTKYTQTAYFSNEHITGGKGWKFEAKRFLDVVIDRCMVEDGEHFIRNTEALDIPMCNSLRLTNNLIENMTGDTLILGGSYGLTISNNYIEYNQSYLDLDSLASDYPHIGLNINGNTFYQLNQQIVDQVPCIKLKNVNAATAHGNGGLFSFGNSVAGSVLYDLTNMAGQSYITGAGDFGKIINSKKYLPVGKPYLESLSDGFIKRSFGATSIYQKQFYISLVPALTETVLEIIPTFTIKPFMTVEAVHSSDNFTLENITVDETANRIRIKYKNNHPTASLNVNPRVSIIDNYSYF